MRLVAYGLGTMMLWAILVSATVAGFTESTGYTENWDTNPPGNNSWYYYVEGQGPLNNGDVPLEWYASGGQSGGYVECPLNELTSWSEIPGTTNYWPFYTYTQYHSINLTETPQVSISLRDSSMQVSSYPFSLGGGQLFFWIGEWLDPDGVGGNEPELSFFYFDSALSVGAQWTDNVINIQNGSWVTLIDTQGKTAQDLLANPQQWGIGILGGSSAPSGELAFDTLTISVPEPATWSLLLLLTLSLVPILRRRAS